jgi:hypothetical protein
MTPTASSTGTERCTRVAEMRLGCTGDAPAAPGMRLAWDAPRRRPQSSPAGLPLRQVASQLRRTKAQTRPLPPTSVAKGVVHLGRRVRRPGGTAQLRRTGHRGGHRPPPRHGCITGWFGDGGGGGGAHPWAVTRRPVRAGQEQAPGLSHASWRQRWSSSPSGYCVHPAARGDGARAARRSHHDQLAALREAAAQLRRGCAGCAASPCPRLGRLRPARWPPSPRLSRERVGGGK